MKKVLFMLAAAALVLVGCNKDPEVVEVTAISLDAEVALLVTDSTAYPLNLAYEPADATLDETLVAWTSSNPEVVTVDAGFLTVAGVGEATVTAEYKGLTATCAVRVVENDFELWAPADIVAFGGDSLLSDQLFEIDFGEGDVETCELFLWDYYIIGSGISIVDNALTGADYVITASFPTFVIKTGDYAGAYISPRAGFQFTADSAFLANYKSGSANEVAYYAPVGTIDLQAYVPYMYYALTDQADQITEELAAAFDESVQGSILLYLDYNEKKAYGPYGLVNEGFIAGADYNFSITWFTGVYQTGINVVDGKVVFEAQDIKYVNSSAQSVMARPLAKEIKKEIKSIKPLGTVVKEAK